METTAPTAGQVTCKVPGIGKDCTITLDFNANTYAFMSPHMDEPLVENKAPTWLKERFKTHIDSGWWVLVATTIDPDLAVDEGL